VLDLTELNVRHGGDLISGARDLPVSELERSKPKKLVPQPQGLLVPSGLLDLDSSLPMQFVDENRLSRASLRKSSEYWGSIRRGSAARAI
jgi:hypothetical protein